MTISTPAAVVASSNSSTHPAAHYPLCCGPDWSHLAIRTGGSY